MRRLTLLALLVGCGPKQAPDSAPPAAGTAGAEPPVHIDKNAPVAEQVDQAAGLIERGTPDSLAAAISILEPLAADDPTGTARFDLAVALTRHSALRGFRIDEPATSFLLQRVGRDLALLMQWLDRIDRFALARQRRITIPLIREAIAAAPRE